MNDKDREWLVRIDERTKNIWRVLDEQEDSVNKKIDQVLEHQVKQNGWIIRNTIWRRVICGVGGSSILFIIGWLIKLSVLE